MDLITLAMAKSYTDGKGGSPVVIDFDNLGITEQLFAGGSEITLDIDENALWKSIPDNGNFIVKFSESDAWTTLSKPETIRYLGYDIFNYRIPIAITFSVWVPQVENGDIVSRMRCSVSFEGNCDLGPDGPDYSKYKTIARIAF